MWTLIQATVANAVETPAGSPGGVLEEGGCQERYGRATVVRMLVNCYRFGINKNFPEKVYVIDHPVL